MAYQLNGSILKSTGLGHFVAPLKFKFANAAAGTVTVLAGAEIVNTITATTNTNACVVTVSLNCSIIDVVDVMADYRDDGQGGTWCSTGNVANEASSNNCTFKIGVFANNGNTITTNNVNANAAVIGCSVVFRNVGVDKGN